MATVIRVSPIETLGQREVRTIAEFLSSFDIILLRASCSWIGHIILPKKKERHNSNWMLARAAFNGHRELCKLAREWRAVDYDNMFENATRGGHRDLCRLAYGWKKFYDLYKLGERWINDDFAR